MAIENTLLYNEVLAIQAQTDFTYYNWTCNIIVGDKTISPFKLINVDMMRDYNHDYSDSIGIEVLLPMGVLHKDIMPFRTNIIVELIKTPVTPVSNGPDKDKVSETQKYRGTLKDYSSPNMKGATPNNVDWDAADLAGLLNVKMQLSDLAIEQIRLRSVGGVFKNCNPAKLLRLLLDKESKKISIPAEMAIKGVDLVEPSNAAVYNHIVIPDGISLVDLPVWMQVNGNGIYSSGMGYYLQKGMWYIYPEFDTTRFTKEPKTITILNIPPNKMPNVEKTYRITANQLIVISTGDLRHYDASEGPIMNEGNGVRFTNANNVVDGFGNFDNGKFTVSRTKNNSEFIGINRDSGINRAMVSDRRITSNPFNEYSKIAARNCEYVQCVWENSNESLIYPGMPAKIVYENNGNVEERMGKISYAQHFVSSQGQTMIENRQLTSSVLTIIISRI